MQRSRAFLLRCWLEGQMTAHEPPCWRFMLEEVGEAHDRHGFATLELLLLFLRREFAVDQDELDDKSNKKSSTEKKGEQP